MLLTGFFTNLTDPTPVFAHKAHKMLHVCDAAELAFLLYKHHLRVIWQILAIETAVVSVTCQSLSCLFYGWLLSSHKVVPNFKLGVKRLAFVLLRNQYAQNFSSLGGVDKIIDKTIYAQC